MKISLVALDFAAWEYDLFVTQRFFNAIPQSARNWGMTRMVNRLNNPVSSLAVFEHAQKFGINTYDDLVEIFNKLGWNRLEKGVEFHHLIEQRFAGKAGVNQWLGGGTGYWKSIVLKAADEHPAFTAQWRYWIPCQNQPPGPLGVNTTTAQLSHIQDAAREIYRDFPEILQALGL